MPLAKRTPHRGRARVAFDLSLPEPWVDKLVVNNFLFILRDGFYVPSHAAANALAQKLGKAGSSGRCVGRRWCVLWRSIVLCIVLAALRGLAQSITTTLGRRLSSGWATRFLSLLGRSVQQLNALKEKRK